MLRKYKFVSIVSCFSAHRFADVFVKASTSAPLPDVDWSAEPVSSSRTGCHVRTLPDQLSRGASPVPSPLRQHVPQGLFNPASMGPCVRIYLTSVNVLSKIRKVMHAFGERFTFAGFAKLTFWVLFCKWLHMRTNFRPFNWHLHFCAQRVFYHKTKSYFVIAHIPRSPVSAPSTFFYLLVIYIIGLGGTLQKIGLNSKIEPEFQHLWEGNPDRKAPRAFWWPALRHDKTPSKPKRPFKLHVYISGCFTAHWTNFLLVKSNFPHQFIFLVLCKLVHF